MLNSGEKAPTLSLPDQNGKPFDLGSIIGAQPLILFFFPKANSMGCTKEACSFRDALQGDEYKGIDVKVIGVCPNSVDDIKRMVDTNKVSLKGVFD